MEKYQTLVMLGRIIIWMIVYVVVSGEQCPEKERGNAEEQFIKELFVDKELRLSPVKNYSKSIKVAASLNLNHIQLTTYDAEQYIVTDIFVTMAYHSKCLTWDRKDHDFMELNNINKYIWEPWLRLENDVLSDMSSFSMKLHKHCSISYDGTIFCMSYNLYMVPCRARGGGWRWPYDKLTCGMKFWPDPFTEQKIKLLYELEVFSEMRGGIARGGWTLHDIDKSVYYPKRKFIERNNNTGFQINMTLKRVSSFNAIYIVFPIFLVAVLTISSLALHIHDFSKVIIGLVSLNLHFGCVSLISNELPKSFPDTPLILTFLRDSLMITGLLLVTALVTYSLYGNVNTPPVLIVAFNNTLRSRSAGKVLFYDVAPGIEPPKQNAGEETFKDGEVNFRNNVIWVQFACLINCTVVVVVSFFYFVYTCLFIHFIVEVNK